MIHALVNKSNNSKIRYMKLSPDLTAKFDSVNIESSQDPIYAFEAVFVTSKTGIIS